ISGCLLALSCAPAAPGRTIYGVKSAPGDPSQVPGYLFACREDGTEAHTVGLLRVGAALVDVDGLALDAGDRLYGFECLPAGARLLEIDPTTGSGVRIGPLLAGRDIRGAAFDHTDSLRAVDAASGQLLTVNPAAGTVTSALTLTLGGSPLQVDVACDLAFDADGRGWLSSGDDVFHLDGTTGVLSFATLVNGRRVAGLCRSIHGLGTDHLFFAHAGSQVDAGWLRTAHGYEMLMLYRNLTPVISTGLADLAGRVLPDPETCAGDADGDNAVTFADLNLILAEWGNAVEPWSMGDVTGDGLVNFADINLTLDAWGEGCTREGEATRASARGWSRGSASDPP
ncbi:MAG: hypothetical protein KDA21_02505, partial [Phycisphaerales bacterium]|nr:hypothetical protein [Phycisphaerales bacterium]